MMRKISVIIPVYNVEKYLRQCLDSVLKQSCAPYEVICVNDGSTDRSGEILNEYVIQYANLKVIEQENSGLSVARNVGLECSTGEYVCFVDSDDFLHKDAIKILTESLEEECYEIIIYENDVVYEGDKEFENKDAYYRVSGDYSDIRDGRVLFCEKVRNNDFVESAWLMLINRKWIMAEKIIFCRGALFEDSVFALQCYFKSKCMKHIKYKLYTYRVREDSIMTQAYTFRHMYYRVWQVKECLNMIYTQANTEEEIEALAKYTMQCMGSARAVYAKLSETDKQRIGELDNIEGLLVRMAKLNDMYDEQTEQLELMGLKSQLENCNGIIIYGAGVVGKKTFQWLTLNQLQSKFIGFAVSSKEMNEENEKYIGRYSPQQGIIVLVAAREAYHSDMVKMARMIGFDNLYRIHYNLEKEIDNLIRNRKED